MVCSKHSFCHNLYNNSAFYSSSNILQQFLSSSPNTYLIFPSWMPIYRIRYCRKQSQQLSTVSCRVAHWDGQIWDLFIPIDIDKVKVDKGVARYVWTSSLCEHPAQHFEQIIVVVVDELVHFVKPSCCRGRTRRRGWATAGSSWPF